MYFKGLIFFFFFLISSEGLVLPHGAAKLSLGEVGEKLEMTGLSYPDLEEPSEEEWTEIISQALESDGIPAYLEARNYTFHATHSGAFNKTNGARGTLKGKSYLLVETGDDRVRLSLFNLDTILMGDHHAGIASKTITLYTEIYKNEAVYSRLKYEVAVELKKNNTCVFVGNSLKFAQGSMNRGPDDKVVYGHNVMSFTNASNVYHVDGASINGAIMNNKNVSYFNGYVVSNSVPYKTQQKLEEMPKDHTILAQILSDSKPSNGFSATFGYFSGDFTSGKTGVYNSHYNSTTDFIVGPPLNSTYVIHGRYDEDESFKGEDIPLRGLLEYILDSVF